MKNTLITNEYQSIVNDRTFRLTAHRLVIKCGVREDLRGSSCLTDAIILYGSETSTSFCEIYRIVGEVRGIKPKSVMREISYAINQAFNLPTKLSALIGTDIPKTDIHNGLVIAYLGMLFKNPNFNIYS